MKFLLLSVLMGTRACTCLKGRYVSEMKRQYGDDPSPDLNMLTVDKVDHNSRNATHEKANDSWGVPGVDLAPPGDTEQEHDQAAAV